MNLANLIPMPFEFWKLAVVAGKDKDWFVRILEGEDSHFRLNINWGNISKDMKTLIDIDGYLKGSLQAPTLYFTESLCRLSVGPKLYFASLEQCEAMEQVDITLPVQEYRQSYPVLGIVLPKEYTQHLARLHPQETDIPSTIVLRHYEQLNTLFACASNPQMEIWHYCFNTKLEETIEDVLRCHDESHGPQFSILHEKLNRVAINLSLLLSNSTLKLKPDNPVAFEKAKRRLQKRPELPVNQVDVASHIHRIVTDRLIVVRERQGAPADSVGTHASPSAHWRRGHWRSQPYGIGNSQRKRVFIRPVFIAGTGEGDNAVIYRPPQ